MELSFSPQSRLALDPGLCLRPDVDRAVIITRPPPLNDRSYVFRLVNPAEAVILALMDGQRTVAGVGELWTELTNKPPDVARSEVFQIVQFYIGGEFAKEHILIEADINNASQLHSYDPLQFVMPVHALNLKERRLRIPYMIYFLPTLFCTQNCVYCYAKTKTRPEYSLISTYRLREIFSELHDLGVEAIQMSGGEVFARLDIFEILRAMVDAGLTPDIPTKFCLTYDMIARLRDLGLSIIQFSLDATEPQILDQMVGVSNYHEQAFKTFENLRLAGFKVRINAVLTTLNVSHLGSMLDYLGNIGNVFRVNLSPYGRSLFRHRDDLFPSDEDIKRTEEIVAEKQDQYPHVRFNLGGKGSPIAATAEERLVSWNQRAYCTANRDGFVILPDGQVTICEELYDYPAYLIGDLRRQSVMEVWRSPQAMALANPDQASVPDGPCKYCEDYYRCQSERGRCYRDVLKCYGWKRPHFPDPTCPFAPPGNRLS